MCKLLKELLVMSKTLKSLVLVGFFLVAAPSSQAAVKFGLAGGVDYNLLKTTILGLETKGGLGFGGGLVADIGPIGTGAIYLSRKSTSTGTVLGIPIEVPVSVGFIHIPLVYRIGMGGVSLNLGGYFDLIMESGGGSDYGLSGGLRFGKKFFVDASYNMGLKGEGDTKTKALIALVGVMF